VLWYGLGKDATVRARRITSSFDGLRFEVQTGKEHFEINQS